MNLLFLTFLTAAALLVSIEAKPAEHIEAAVEIEKQRLVKFPDDAAQDQKRDDDDDDATKTADKNDEAKRILQEIAKINQALGYVKKQPEQRRIPPILDSSQYLFPKPAYHPFHQQSHQIAGSHGETLLVPSIRAVKFDAPQEGAPKSIAYNIPPQRNLTKDEQTQKAANASVRQNQQQLMSLSEYQTYLSKQESPKVSRPQHFYRPNQVIVPAPQSAAEQQQLPTHFVIPVRLYKHNKQEYVQRHAPQEYRVKGYKIVGDIDNFYGKAKSKNKTHKTGAAKTKSTPKYHLLFLPRELAESDSSGAARNKLAAAPTSNASGIVNPTQESSSREEKMPNRPFKIQSSASTTSGNGQLNSSTVTVVKKRVVPKPLGNKQTPSQVNLIATQQQPDGSSGTAVSSIYITPKPKPLALNSNNQGTGSFNNNTFSFLRPANIGGNMEPSKNNTAANVIKNAFQNIFKFPFRQDQLQQQQQHLKPEATTESFQLETVPLQQPPKTFFTFQSQLQQLQPQQQLFHNTYAQPQFVTQQQQQQQQLLPQPFYDTNNAQHVQDYDDSGSNSNSNSAAEEEAEGGAGYEDSSPEVEEKIFGHHHLQQQQALQKEAIKQGGIIIQKLKVRKGGIAIAGPGGVATAGSGGTAIVGPGGYALTHPRSLTIAGPGAKIIAIPADVDLGDALARTNLEDASFPREGKIVAYGPTVYYSPATGTDGIVEI